MPRVVTTILFFVCSGLAAGCATEPQLGPAKDVVTRSIDTMGGLSAWRNVDQVYASAVVAIRDSSGVSRVERLKLTMMFSRGEILAEGVSPQGEWAALAKRDGRCSVKGPAPMDKATLGPMLAVILHRVAGPLNLVLDDEKVLDAGPSRQGGFAVNRVSVKDSFDRRYAYYFDTSTSLLRYLTAGDETPAGQGTVTVYGGPESYITLPGGLLLAKQFRVNRVGQNVLVGETPVLEVNLSDVRRE